MILARCPRKSSIQRWSLLASLKCLVWSFVLIAAIGCSPDESNPSIARPTDSGTSRAEQYDQLSGDEQQRLMTLAVGVSVAARSSYAALGREGRYPSPAAGTKDSLAMRADALVMLLEDLERALSEFEMFVREHPSSGQSLVIAELSLLRIASEHIHSTIEDVVERDRFSMIHHLYVERVDDHLFAILRLLIADQELASSRGLVQMMLSFLDYLSEVNSEACVELQCSLYGVRAPLPQTDRVRLTLPASRMLAIEPAMRYWWSNWEASDNSREFVRDVVSTAWYAAYDWSSAMFDLIDGADESARDSHLTSYHPLWPFNAVSVAERLLKEYAKILNAQSVHSTD